MKNQVLRILDHDARGHVGHRLFAFVLPPAVRAVRQRSIANRFELSTHIVAYCNYCAPAAWPFAGLSAKASACRMLSRCSRVTPRVQRSKQRILEKVKRRCSGNLRSFHVFQRELGHCWVGRGGTLLVLILCSGNGRSRSRQVCDRARSTPSVAEPNPETRSTRFVGSDGGNGARSVRALADEPASFHGAS